jgi:hypothetical protein
MFFVFAVIWATAGLASSAFAVVVVAGVTSYGTRHDDETGKQAAALAGMLGGIPLLVAGVACFTIAVLCWLGSVRFRWMAAMYTRRQET